MRGRRIMGALVPYDRVWCPGADEATTLMTNRTLRLGDLTLPAGRYTLWMLPGENAWTLIVNAQTGQWHTDYAPSCDIGRVPLTLRRLAAPIQQLTFQISRARGGGVLSMKWETTDVSAPFSVVQ